MIKLRQLKHMVEPMLLFLGLFMFDHVTKFWALKFLSDASIQVTSWFNLSLILNRGVACGLFFFDSCIGFYFITALVMCVTVLFGAYMLKRIHNHESWFFEVCVFTGAISNIVDRFVYKGVVDFIELHYASWYWPTFNVADICVVIGVVGILIKQVRASYDGMDKGV